jgi:hypothetical protein
MKAQHTRWLLGAPAIAMLVALTGCGDHRGGIESTQMPMVDRPNVEIVRQGMPGAEDIAHNDAKRRD